MYITSREGPAHEKRKLNRQLANRREAFTLESSAGELALSSVFHLSKIL